MTQPRWTEVKTSGGDTFRLAYRERRAVPGMPWCDDLIVRHFEPVPQHARLSPAGFDALVAAVRDADTLHQARAVYKELLDAAKEQCRLGPVRTTTRLHAATRQAMALARPVPPTPEPTMGKPIRPEDPHEWEPPDSRLCAICGVDLDDHPEPDLTSPAPDTGAEAEWRRSPACVEQWPDCEPGEYNPACCRFPKSCSCLEPAPDTGAELLMEAWGVIANAADWRMDGDPQADAWVEAASKWRDRWHATLAEPVPDTGADA